MQAGEFFQPIASHQVGTGGESLADFDEAGSESRQAGENASGQPLLHVRVAAVALGHNLNRQPPQGEHHHQQTAQEDPGAQQQPAEVSIGLIEEVGIPWGRTGRSHGADGFTAGCGGPWNRSATGGKGRGVLGGSAGDGQGSMAAGQTLESLPSRHGSTRGRRPAHGSPPPRSGNARAPAPPPARPWSGPRPARLSAPPAATRSRLLGLS